MAWSWMPAQVEDGTARHRGVTAGEPVASVAGTRPMQRVTSWRQFPPSPMPPFRRRAQLVLSAAVLLAGCGAESALDHDDLAGEWVLTAVDGFPVGRYRWTSTNCQAAFTSGTLSLDTDDTWLLTLPYDYRCFHDNGYDGSSVLVVQGMTVTATTERVLLRGMGPDLVSATPLLAPWTLEVRRQGDQLEVRFTDDARLVWNNPILTMSPGP